MSDLPGPVRDDGVEELLAPGVAGYTVDMPDGGLNIPWIRAVVPGSGDVGRYLDSLPQDRRIFFPCILSERLAEMLVRRGFRPAQHYSEDFGEWVGGLERSPEPTQPSEVTHQEAPKPCKHDRSSHFDRSICARDGWMHTFCDDCGQPLDGECGDSFLPVIGAASSQEGETPLPTGEVT